LPLKLPVEPVLDGAEELEEPVLLALELPVVVALPEVELAEDPVAVELPVKVVENVALRLVLTGAAAMQNVAEDAKISLMLPILTAVKLYWQSAGTMGHSIETGLSPGCTLFARANEFRKEGWFNSSENAGSLEVSEELKVTSERNPEVTFDGASKLIAPRTKGRAAAATQSLANILGRAR